VIERWWRKMGDHGRHTRWNAPATGTSGVISQRPISSGFEPAGRVFDSPRAGEAGGAFLGGPECIAAIAIADRDYAPVKNALRLVLDVAARLGATGARVRRGGGG
jgi:hypothetical protein